MTAIIRFALVDNMYFFLSYALFSFC